MTQKIQNILYAPLNLALHALARLPWWALYAQADILYFVAYHLLRYRRKIVRRNLRDSFPDKSEEEIKAIERESYHQFTDYFVETIKMLHITDDDIKRRFVFHGVDNIDRAFDQGRSIMMYAAHYGNWEWLMSVTLWTRHKPGQVTFGQVYQPLENEWFNRFFLHLRGRFGSVCYPKRLIYLDMLRQIKRGKQMVVGFISDQHPLHTDEGHVIKFLNHPTAMISASEVIARRLGLSVMYFDVRKIGRGHYECTVVPICDDPATLPQGEITDRYARLLERRIVAEPPYWLWTHNRWKRKVQYPEASTTEPSKKQQQ